MITKMSSGLSSSQNSISSDDIMKELDQFLHISSKAITDCSLSQPLTQEELKNSNASLKLLKNLPPARPAVLAYLGHLLGKQVYTYMHSNNRVSEASSSSNPMGKELAVRIEEELRNHIEDEAGETGGGLWCELVCGWGVEMLSMWGSEWGGIKGILEEIVATWLNCNSVKAVVSLVTLCVAKEPQGAVAHILNTASHCSPTLDWLVAHIGASHPGPVLAHLLDPSVQVSLEADKLDRTTNILSHLSIQHSGAVSKALTGLFMRTVHGHCWPGAGPQLLLLLTRSGPLLDTVSPSLPQLLTPATLNRIAKQSSAWVPTYFRSWNDVQQICVKLILDSGSPLILLSMLQGIHSPLPMVTKETDLLPIVKNGMTVLMHRLLLELMTVCYSRRKPKHKLQLLVSIGDAKSLIDYAMSSNNVMAAHQTTQIVAMSCCHQVAPNLFPYLLHNFTPSPSLLHMTARVTLAMIREHNKVTDVDGDVLMTPMSAVVSKTGSSLVNAIVTLDLLTSSPLLNAPISAAICGHLPKFAQLINLPEVGDKVLKLLSKIKLKFPLSLSHTSCLSHAVVTHFLATLEFDDTPKKLIVVSHCTKLLCQLSGSSCGQGLVTRLLVESVFRHEWAHVFGASVTDAVYSRIISSGISDKRKPLLNANYNFDSWVKMPQSHTTIFHAGTISSNKKSVVNKSLPKECVETNTQLLLNTLYSVSSHHEQLAPITIAFLLVEIISPDIMYNGFPWHDENIKFTIERDLTIKKKFEEFPIAWELLELVASYRPHLCFCSVLVRALTASYISMWSNSALPKCSDLPMQLRFTERLLEVMVTGQFLPPNLQVLPQMIRHLAPYETVSILQEVWNYMRDNTPSPNRLKDRSNQLADPRAFEVCRRMIVFHIESLGHLLPYLLSSNAGEGSSSSLQPTVSTS